MAKPTIVLAGAAGDLGARIAKALIARGTTVRALVRTGAPDAGRNRLSRLGADAVVADETDAGAADLPHFRLWQLLEVATLKPHATAGNAAGRLHQSDDREGRYRLAAA